jgi:two-component system heavy metal sensor histidine kinase CusS
MTAQISLAVMLIAALLVAGSSMLVLRLSKQELGDIGDAVLLSNMAFLQQELAETRAELPLVGAALVERIESQAGSLHVALLDERRQPIVAGSGGAFPVPLALLPAEVLPAVLLPSRLTPGKARALRASLGLPTRDLTLPDGSGYRVLVGSIAMPSGVNLGAGEDGSVLAVLALETASARELVLASGRVIGLALLLSTLIAAVAGVWLARRIVVAARRLGSAAGRIGANDLTERLPVADLPIELQDAGEAFNAMLARLQASFTRLQEFSSDLAHDLRTPINNLLGEAQVALSRPRSADEYRAVLESAVEDYERLSRLLENMLFLARADDAKAVLQREWIDPAQLFERVRDYFEPLAEDRALHLLVHCTLAQPGAALWADRTMLVRALANLLSNALRHAEPGSTVRLSATVGAAGGSRIAVGNRGPAIPVQYQQKIFERLFRIDPAREGSSEGSGLGLAIVSSVMALHGGSVAVASAEGQETVFTLSFPSAPPLPEPGP